MATMTATNQHYYGSYPIAQSIGSMAPNASGIQTYQQQSYNSQSNQQHQHQQHHQHHHHHQQQQQQQQQEQQQQQHQQQVQPYQHHQQVVSSSIVAANQTQLTQLNSSQRTLSTSTTNSSNSASAAAAAALYNSIEATKSTKGASKLRRDLINTEIAQLRELLPLPASTRQRLSQLQLMALVLVYVRKSNYFRRAFEIYGIAREPSLAIPANGFSKALNGFLMMLTQKGKLLYISDNAAEYLGHSMEDLLSHGDEVYDIIEDQDKKIIKTELLSNDEDNQGSPATKSLQQSTSLPSKETRIALCRMNVSRNARRQMRFGDQKVVLIEGHYDGFLPLSSRDEPVFLATCTPIAMPETRECVVQGSTNVFTSIHSMDMKFLYIDGIGEHHLGYTKQQIHGMSWYELVHFDHLHEAQLKHKRITTNDQERSTIVLLRLMNQDQTNSVWVHSVMQVKEASDSTTQPVIVCTNQVLSEREAQVMRSNSWLYQFYSLHSKAHCNFSSNSPLRANQTETPTSVCSDSEEQSVVEVKAEPTNNTASTTINTSSASIIASELSVKSPPANLISSQVESAGNRHSETFISLENYGSNSTGLANNFANTNGSGNYQTLSSNINKNTVSSKLSPLTHSPSSSSTISSSPLSSSSYQTIHTNQRNSYHQLTNPGNISQPISNQNTIGDVSGVSVHQHHLGSVGSSSASSSSSSSTSSITSQNEVSTTPTTTTTNHLASHSVAQSMAVAAAAGNTAAAAASLYGIDAVIDPLQHVHHSHHHHPMYSATTANQHHPAAANHHHHHAAAAVNYANQVMAAQRVAHQQSHHHHHPYHPYHHQHHSAVHNHHNPHHHHHQSSHVAPHHHNHHTTPHPLYGATAPNHHQVAAATASSAVALNSAFSHHHHAAAYHSAAVAAVSAHPAHNHHNTNPIPTAYHSASAAAAAAAAAAHPGVSFHYNKIAAVR